MYKGHKKLKGKNRDETVLHAERENFIKGDAKNIDKEIPSAQPSKVVSA